MYQRIATSSWTMPRSVSGHRRILVESPDPLLRSADFGPFEEAGFEVAVCAGPGAGSGCPLADGEPCPFVIVSDLVLFGLDTAGGEGREVLEALRTHHPETPVVVAVPRGEEDACADLPAGCTPLPFPSSFEEKLAVFRAAAGPVPRVTG